MVQQSVVVQNKRKQILDLLHGNRLEDARNLLEEICRKEKRDVESRILLAQINAKLNLPDQVEKYCREIIQIIPNSLDAYFHLGCSLVFQDKRDAAIQAFQKLLQLKPDHALSHIHLGNLSANISDALKHYTRAAQLAPNLADAYNSIGAALASCGRIEEAISNFRRSLAINPALHVAHSSLLFTLNCSSTLESQTIFSEHAQWEKLHALPRSFRYANTVDPERRLRVGYVSPDFRSHSVSYFFEPLLSKHDQNEIETFCYADVSRPDSTTNQLKSLAMHWCMTAGMSDDELAKRIHADGIDILVDLAGHTAHNRLRAFSAKPAPVQITYLGYPNTSGLMAMDYRLTDDFADPPGMTDSFYTEELIRLPHSFLCYRPPADAPPVAQPPSSVSGRITYGSYNNMQKVTREAISVWAAILKAVPDSRLVLKNFALADSLVRERCQQAFAEYGIAADRFEFRARDNTVAEHLNSYSTIDIALDTFPYNGTTTTCEALWMGVPVIALAGNTHAGRVGVSLLNQVGFAGFIAETSDNYIKAAVDLARNRHELPEMRLTLRERMANSPLCNGSDFARNVEDVYRSMWRKWCSKSA